MTNLGTASAGDVKTIYKTFRLNKDVFPHIRSDYIRRACEEGRCIYHSGVVIIWQQYQKSVRLGSVTIPRDSIMLHQIVNSTDQRGTAADVFRRFADALKRPIYLSVRGSNVRARRFYEKVGMKPIGSITWSNGSIPGVIYSLSEESAS